MSHPLLPNIVWHCLAGPHAAFAAGTGSARRYAREFPPIIGFADNDRPDFPALAPYCEIGEHFYCGGWTGPVPSGWQLHADALMHQMIWDGAMPSVDSSLDAVRLGPQHVPQMLDLVAATQPGPFGPRNIELGNYFGVFDAARLVAMAGERFAAGTLREVSAVCTHPDFQGRGLARRLVEQVIRLAIARNQTPFLHVMQDNLAAKGLYQRMGFRHAHLLAVRAVSRAQ